ncbi:MAG: carbohydrate-binding family 9-like protein [Bacteroidales bacterium]
MKIKQITNTPLSIEAIDALMRNTENCIETLSVDQINWPEEYPYKPEVKLRIAKGANEIYLQYDVREDQTMALVTEDNGRVWTDSCCEFFISFDESGYYNLEMNSIGKALLGFRKTKTDAEHASQEVMDSIRILTTMGNEPFAEIKGDNRWSLTVAIPMSAFFRHNITELDGLKGRFNAFKCGDDLSVPHFASLFPITVPTPNFHLEEFFGEIEF